MQESTQSHSGLKHADKVPELHVVGTFPGLFRAFQARDYRLMLDICRGCSSQPQEVERSVQTHAPNPCRRLPAPDG